MRTVSPEAIVSTGVLSRGNQPQLSVSGRVGTTGSWAIVTAPKESMVTPRVICCRMAGMGRVMNVPPVFHFLTTVEYSQTDKMTSW